LEIYTAILPQEEDMVVQPAGMHSKLRSYQRKAVAWMMKKERAPHLPILLSSRSNYSSSPSSSSSSSTTFHSTQASTSPTNKLHYLWQEMQLGDGTTVYYNSTSGRLSREFHLNEEELLYGGILADEMGLGKTVEVIACVLSNPFSK